MVFDPTKYSFTVSNEVVRKKFGTIKHQSNGTFKVKDIKDGVNQQGVAWLGFSVELCGVDKHDETQEVYTNATIFLTPINENFETEEKKIKMEQKWCDFLLSMGLKKEGEPLTITAQTYHDIVDDKTEGGCYIIEDLEKLRVNKETGEETEDGWNKVIGFNKPKAKVKKVENKPNAVQPVVMAPPAPQTSGFQVPPVPKFQ